MGVGGGPRYPHRSTAGDDVERQVLYLVGAPRSKVAEHDKKWLDQPWHQVRDSVGVKLFGYEGELWVLAESEGRRAKGPGHTFQTTASFAQTNSAGCGSRTSAVR